MTESARVHGRDYDIAHNTLKDEITLAVVHTELWDNGILPVLEYNMQIHASQGKIRKPALAFAPLMELHSISRTVPDVYLSLLKKWTTGSLDKGALKSEIHQAKVRTL